MEGFLGDSNRPDFGNINESGLAIRNKESTAYTDLMGQTAATGIAEAGKVEAAGIVGAAQASAAQAQGQAAIMEGIGGIASSAIGAFGGGGGGSKGYVTPGGIETGLSKSAVAPTQLGVNHFNLSTGIPGLSR